MVLVFGALAWILKKLDFPSVPILLGMVLGKMTETNFRRALLLSDGSLSIFFESPICIAFMVLITGTLISIVVGKIKEKKAEKAQ